MISINKKKFHGLKSLNSVYKVEWIQKYTLPRMHGLKVKYSLPTAAWIKNITYSILLKKLFRRFSCYSRNETLRKIGSQKL